MPTLSLFRHAKAAAPLPGQQDFDRPLTERGRGDASDIGKIIAELRVEQAIVSAARRTQETWEIAASRLDRDMPKSIEQALYLCRPSVLIDRIHAIADDCSGVVLVGHNPCWHEVALWLASAAGAGSLKHKFPTAALAVFTFTRASWGNLQPRDVKLERFVTPEMLS